jgi:hypothetical protein
MVGTAVMLAVFFLVVLLITVLMRGEEGLTDGGRTIGIVAIE